MSLAWHVRWRVEAAKIFPKTKDAQRRPKTLMKVCPSQQARKYLRPCTQMHVTRITIGRMIKLVMIVNIMLINRMMGIEYDMYIDLHTYIVYNIAHLICTYLYMYTHMHIYGVYIHMYNVQPIHIYIYIYVHIYRERERERERETERERERARERETH